jgi:hypothetical protein
MPWQVELLSPVRSQDSVVVSAAYHGMMLNLQSCAKTQKSKSGSGKIDLESGKNIIPQLESGKTSGKNQKKLLVPKKSLLAQKTHEFHMHRVGSRCRTKVYVHSDTALVA